MSAVMKERRFHVTTMQQEYDSLLRTARYKLRRVRNRNTKKKIEVEIAYIMNEFVKYGSQFFPEHYLSDKMDELRAIVDKI